MPEIRQEAVENFETLMTAMSHGDVAMVTCEDIKTKQPIEVICVAVQGESGETQMIPFAKMFAGNPYDEVHPPTGVVLEEDSKDEPPVEKG